MKKSKGMLFIIMVLIIAGAVVMYSDNEKKDSNQVETENKNVEIVSNTVPDEKTPEEITYVSLNDEDKIGCCSVLGCFDNGKELSTEQYLSVACNCINCGYISNHKDKYTEKEIKSIVYSIFNVELNENTSIEGMQYSNGIYYMDKKQSPKTQLFNIERGTAAGSTYISYQMEGKDYIARLTTNGVTGEIYISSIITNE